MTGLRFPCQLIHVQPHDCPHMTRGYDGSANPFMWGSFIPYSMPVYPGAFITSPEINPDWSINKNCHWCYISKIFLKET